MRKTLEAITLIALTVLVWFTWQALNGPAPLPDRIPTHFDATGNPNGWGPASTLWLLPAVAIALYLGMTLMSRFPASFNYPVKLTEENSARLKGLSLDMLAWVRLEIICLFAYIQWSTIEVANHGHGGLRPALLPISAVVIFGTVCWHIAAMLWAGRAGAKV
ncbi:MAG: DUF1648 domain-containing protein [Terracidiphilus sp.]